MNATRDDRMMVALVCPTCSRFLDHSLEHALRCAGCARSFPVRAGVPRLIAAQPQGSDELTAAAFTWHGRQFADLSAEHERHFLDVVAPMVPVDFRGKAVLDAGCGTGRNALFAARYGARQVWAMDLGDVVLTAKQLTDSEPKVSVVQADMLNPPFPKGSDMMGFDFIFSIGVIHHLADPGAGVKALARLLRTGGELFVWVYADEGNGVVRRLVDTLRKLTTRIPESLLPVLTWPLALGLHSIVRGLYATTRGSWLGRVLPARAYFEPLIGFSFRRKLAIVTDQLVAPQTRYVRLEELRAWLVAAGLEEIAITSRNGNSWRARGRRSSTARDENRAATWPSKPALVNYGTKA